jgi:hypothetical protein
MKKSRQMLCNFSLIRFFRGFFSSKRNKESRENEKIVDLLLVILGGFRISRDGDLVLRVFL